MSKHSEKRRKCDFNFKYIYFVKHKSASIKLYVAVKYIMLVILFSYSMNV